MQKAVWELVYGIEDLYPHNLEQSFPRVMEKVAKLWPTPMMEGYFRELMVNERADRQGFSPEVAMEIYYLSKVFEGTRNFPRKRDDNLLAHVNNKPTFGANFDGSQSGSFFKYSQLDFINTSSPSDDSPWHNIDPDKHRAVVGSGYPCTASGFMEAVGAGDVRAISLFLDCKINIDTCDERSWTPLTIAVYNGREALANLLVRKGANVHTKDAGGYSPMHWAAFKGHSAIVKSLIMNDADVNSISQLGWTPLMAAAMNGHLDVCATLIAAGANTNLSTQDGWTALQKASAYNHHAVVRLFLSLMKVNLIGTTPNKKKVQYSIRKEGAARPAAQLNLSLDI